MVQITNRLKNEALHLQVTIDLDILLFSDSVIEEGDLLVPHPRMCERSFVLEPLCEIAPGVVHPREGKTIRQLLEDLLNKETAAGPDERGET